MGNSVLKRFADIARNTWINGKLIDKKTSLNVHETHDFPMNMLCTSPCTSNLLSIYWDKEAGLVQIPITKYCQKFAILIWNPSHFAPTIDWITVIFTQFCQSASKVAFDCVKHLYCLTIVSYYIFLFKWDSSLASITCLCVEILVTS